MSVLSGAFNCFTQSRNLKRHTVRQTSRPGLETARDAARTRAHARTTGARCQRDAQQRIQDPLSGAPIAGKCPQSQPLRDSFESVPARLADRASRTCRGVA